jgi:ectoine hydroxylase-related dioxygenase (phytanoyl-CoA dioxygenase family)
MLAPLTNDPAVATGHLLEYGICRLEGALGRDDLVELREAVQKAAADDAAGDQAYVYSNEANQRIWCLFNRGECFIGLADNPPTLAIIRTVLGDDALLSNLSANVTGPGGLAMAPHWDQDWAQRPWPHALVAHVIWMIDDFTEENGATLVAPRSHLGEHTPGAKDLVPATGPAGTALIVDGRTWHGTGSNNSVGDRRTGILAYYCRSYIRQQENIPLSLRADVREKLGEQRRELFGIGFHNYLNMVGGPPAGLPRF